MRHSGRVCLLTSALATVALAGHAQPIVSNLVFTSVQPCRLFDTRSATAGILAAGVPRTFNVVGAVNLSPQGGAAGGCGIPGFSGGPRVQAVSINYVAVDPTGPGFLVAWPTDQPVPGTSIINFAATGTGLNIANGTTTAVRQDVAGGDITIVAGVSSTHVIGDVVGYYSLLTLADGPGSGMDGDTLDGLDSTAFWKLGGNTATTPGTHFLGTTDAQALEIKVEGQRAARVAPASGTTGSSPNILWGHPSNLIQAGTSGVVISGGGNLIRPQFAADFYATIAGGADNTAGSLDGNPESAGFVTVGGGRNNRALAAFSTIPGGVDARTNLHGQLAYSAGGFGNVAGSAQTSIYVLRQETSGTVAGQLFLDGTGASMTVPANAAWAFDALIVGSTGSQTAGYQIRGVVDGGILVGAPTTTVLAEDDATWNATVTSGLTFTVVGGAGDNVRWVATVRTAEVTP